MYRRLSIGAPRAAQQPLLALCFITSFILGCGSNRLGTERIFYSLERSVGRESSFDFSVGTRCYQLELSKDRSLPRLLGAACPEQPNRLLLDFAAILPGDLTLVRSIRVSPDGAHVAFTGLVRGEEKLLVTAITSPPTTTPTRILAAPFGFEWLADSTRLLLVRQSEDSPPQLTVASVPSDTEVVLPFVPRAGTYLHIERSSRGDSVFVAERDGLAERWSAVSAYDPSVVSRQITSGDSRALVCDSDLHRIIVEDSPQRRGLMHIRSGREHHQVSLPVEATVASISCFAQGVVLTVQDGWGQKLLRLCPASGRITPLNFSAPWVSLLPGQSYSSDLLTVRLEGAALKPQSGSFVLSSGELSEAARSDSTTILVEQFEALSPDGTLVPVVSYSRPSHSRSELRPILLHTYGAYGQTVSGAFRPEVVALLDRGITYTVANIRGGGGRGALWHRAGSGGNVKKRVDDIVAVTQALKERYRGAWIVGYGRSAGAIPLLAAATTSRELFAGLILDAPLLRPLAPQRAHPAWELKEWGDYNPGLDALRLLEQARPPPTFVSYSKFDRAVSSEDILEWAARSLSLFGTPSPISLYPVSSSSHAGSDFLEAHNRLAARQITFMLELLESSS